MAKKTRDRLHQEISVPHLEPIIVMAGARDLGLVREFTGLLAPEFFTDGTCGWVWENLIEEARDPKRKVGNLPALVEKAKASGLNEDSLAGMMEKGKSVSVENPAELRNVGEVILRAGLHRFLMGRLAMQADRLHDITEPKVLEKVSADLMRDVSRVLTGSIDTKVSRLGSRVDEVLESIRAGKKLIRFYPLQFKRLNNRFGGGAVESGLTVFSARGGVGKSMFLLNVAHHYASQGIPVLYLDTEMSEDQVMARLFSLHTQAKLRDVVDASVELDSSVLEKAEVLKKLPLYWMSIASTPIEQGTAIIRRWFHTHDCSKGAVVIWDYLKMQISDADFGRNLQEFQSLGVKAQLLKDLAIELVIPVITAVQLNRTAAVKGDSRDITDDETAFAGSDRIYWFADSAVLMRPKTVDEESRDGVTQGNMKMTVVKARHGEPHTWFKLGDKSNAVEREYISMFARYSQASFVEGLESVELFDALANEKSRMPGDSEGDSSADDSNLFD